MSNDAAPPLAGGSYEVIRERLLATAKVLGEKAEALNARRRAEFGGQELSVLGAERVRTENNCVPRDLVPVGPFLLMGFNVFMGLKQERSVGDVFSLHRFERKEDGGFDFAELPRGEAGGFLEDRRFVKDFEELFRFYKDARLTQLVSTDARLLAVFRTGLSPRDVKVLRFSVDTSGRVTYLDNRGEADWVAPPTHDFEWTRLGREAFVAGRHPHVNVLDEVFIETLGGDLTVKVENNTETGQGVYSDPVQEPTQSLDDAEFSYVRIGGLILLKVLPFRERAHRYLVFNSRTRQVLRADAIGQSCVTLPEDQGIAFPGGYVLQTGEAKLFDQDVKDLTYHRALKSPNGEDVLYVFFSRESGASVLFPYNVVRKQVASPITAHGYAVFPDGRLVVARSAGDEPTRVHPVQVWQTPFVSAEFAAAAPTPRTALGKLGNAELVRGVSEVLTLERLAKSDAPSRRGYEALVQACTRAVDQFHWLGQPEVGLLPLVQELRQAAALIVDEFEKVLAMQRKARELVAAAEIAQAELLRQSAPDALDGTDAFMAALGALQRQLGHLISLKEVRWVDVARVTAMEAEVQSAFQAVSAGCVEFLLKPQAFAPLHQGVRDVDARCQAVTRTAELEPLVQEVERLSQGLTLLGEIVGGLESGDPTQKAKILEDVSEVFAGLNRVRATVLARRKELMGREKRAEFTGQFKLFAQAIDSALSLADTPARCDEQLTRLTLQLEELEGRYADLDEFAADLASRREDLLEAFGKRKQVLVDERQRRARNLVDAGERILQAVGRRAASFATEDELNAYFAADPMLQKLRQLVQQLLELEDSVKADELDSRLKAAKQDALRGLRDRLELFEGGQAVVRLGAHRFNVNTQPLEATVVPREDGLFLQLTGSDYAQRLVDPDIDAARPFWSQTLPSESPEVYRGEYLAALVLRAAEAGRDGLSLAALHEAARAAQGLAAVTRAWAQARYDDGLERGVHDADAARILEGLLTLHADAGLLRFPAWPRALATLFWSGWRDEAAKASWHRRALSLGRLRARYASRSGLDAVAAELLPALRTFAEASRLEVSPAELAVASRYLSEELADEPLRFAVSRDAVSLRDHLLVALDAAGQRLVFEEDLRALDGDVSARFRLGRAWLEAHAATAGEHAATFTPVVSEAAALLAVDEARLSREVSSAVLEVQVTGLLGQHPRLQGQALTLRLDEIEQRMTWFLEERGPAFQRYRAKVRGLLEAERARLRIDELRPRVLSSFVRNRLIDEVYLPLIGANLAKQLGAAGDTKRTDRMGLLLLVSPPGYGKTTLMEYVAARLGLSFVKVNGPALGHDVVSVDPQEAPNATARQEVERINFAFELGNNVMLYLDDIQHTNPELLQKFISLCDATRKVEGVWNGRSRTYDLRGKKFCVVMAGNPYTESGERFRIPDMLANRADTYNLGDILGGKEALFASSYLENALTSNPVTAPLLARPTGDLRKIFDMAQGAALSANELEHAYSAAELQEIVEVLRRFQYVQRTLLRVNQEYIRSASQDDRFRTEPPFKLQGSYRNMGKLADKIVSAMTDGELEALLDAHYASESQTLTAAAESNLLKLAELRGRQTPEQRTRWDELKRGFKRVQVQGGGDDDPVVRVTGSIAALGEELGLLKAVVEGVASRPAPPPPPASPPPEALGPRLEQLTRAVLQGAQPRPPSDVGPKLDAIAQVLGQVGRALVTTAPREELRPWLERMTQELSAIAQRPSAPAAMDLGPVLERLSAQQPPPPSNDAPLREEMAHQMLLIQERLQELAASARAVLQADPEGAVKATLVWQQAKEAIELLKALPSRGRRSKGR
jgi:hypothetical protein